MRRADEVRSALRAAILSGAYAPRQRLIESELVAEYDTTRSVLRTALVQLSEDGLVEIQPNRGARVREVTLEEAAQLVEVRRAVEGLIAARAAELATDEQIEGLIALGGAMREAVERLELLKYSDLNAELHGRLREIADHATATRIIEQLHGQMVRHQFMLSLTPGRPATSLGEHLAIIDAVAARDPGAAEDAMRRHLTSVLDSLAVFRPGSQPAAPRP